MDEAHASPLPVTIPTRHALLVALRRAGPATPDSLARELGVSRTAVLQQLRALETAALAARSAERHGVGRPRHLYDLTDAAQALFPTNYAGLARGLLEALRAVGDNALVEAVFAARRARQVEAIRRRFAARGLDGASLVERVCELAVIQDEQGYLCECRAGEAAAGGPWSGPILVEADGAIRLREHNCAIFEVAREIPAACRSELELFQEVLGADVRRESHILAGDRTCTYRIGAPAGD
jgi:predicted ArsR family transcriptional regulator